MGVGERKRERERERERERKGQMSKKLINDRIVTFGFFFLAMRTQITKDVNMNETLNGMEPLDHYRIGN